MKKSHKREILMARVVFGVFLIAVVLIVAVIVTLVSSKIRAGKDTDEDPTGSNTVVTQQKDTENDWFIEPSTPTSETESETENEPEVPQVTYRWTTAENVNLRSEPNTDCEVLKQLPKNTKVEWKSEADGWATVVYEGNTGYLSTDYLTDKDPAGDAQQPEAEKPQEDQTSKNYDSAADVMVCIDPGHQTNGDSTQEANGPGSTTMKARVTGGATGVSTNVPEYRLNLDISLLLQKELEDRGYQVCMTRTTNDVNLSNKERAEYATQMNATISVRIHANSTESSSVNGALTVSPSESNPYVADLYEDSMKLSESILKEYCAATGLSNKGCTTSDTMSGINWSTVPVTILELGFMSNAQEDEKMQDSDFQKKMVRGIADGIDDYFGF